MHHVLHERIPCPSFKTLSTWWKHKSMTVKSRVIRHYVIKVVGTLKLLNHLDIIGEIKLLNFFPYFRFMFCLFFY
jgi:DNA polymerase zeta